MKVQLQISLLVFTCFVLPRSSLSSNVICKDTGKCRCVNNLNHYEYQCSINQQEDDFILQVYPNSLIKIDCINSLPLDPQMLPKETFENVNSVQITSCPVPQNGIKEIVDHFGIKTLKFLTFEYGVFENSTFPTAKFSGFKNVTRLRLRSNDLKYIDGLLGEHFPELDSLELDRNNLELTRDTFLLLEKLKFLSIMGNKLEEISNGAFQELKNLKKLMLFGNRIKYLNSSAFEGLNSLKTLELSHNRLELIVDGCFNALPNLTTISIRSNHIKKLTKSLFASNILLEQIETNGNIGMEVVDDVFSGFKYLKIVELGNLGLEKIPENLFRNSTNLESISLTNNKITDIPKYIFKNLKELKNLSLSINRIQQLDDHIFSDLSKLEKLDLQHNNLGEINQHLFRNFVKLKELDLSFNNIKHIHADAFGSLRNLVRLNVSHNRYGYTDDGGLFPTPFNRLVDLQKLDLSHNEIMDFPEDLMILTSMTDISLNWNNITSLRINALWKVTTKELKIDLNNNKISRLNFNDVEVTAMQQKNLDAYHIVGSSLVVQISNNPIICDCFVFDLVRYIRNEMYPGVKTAIYIVYDHLECSSPDIFKNIPVEDITPPMLSCPIHDIIKNFSCSSETSCACGWRPYDQSIVFRCENMNLTRLPELYYPSRLIYNQTEVNLGGNLLTRGPNVDDVGYGNVTKLILRNNSIDEITWIPPHLEVLNIEENKIQNIRYDILEMLNTTHLQKVLLGGNPWICECKTSNLTNYLRLHVDQVDAHRIFCAGSTKPLINLSERDLCPHHLSLYLTSGIILVFLLCLLTSTAAFYYKYQQEIKVWLYANNLFLFLIKEEELDKDKIYDAFLSYSHQDEEFVIENLINVLEGGTIPYKLCLHFRNWIPGEFIATQVNNSVRDSRRTLVVLSPNFLESVWGKMEFRTAHTEAMKEGRARVIIILYGDINMESIDEELKAYMKTNTYIKWGDPWFWDKLKYALPHSKIKGQNKRQKHANMMKYIDDKFSLIDGKTTPCSSMISISEKTGKFDGVEGKFEENSIMKHEIM